MAQHDYVIDNQTAPNFRADLNQALSAIVSTNSGLTAPSTTYANMLWYDTSANILKMRNEADDTWINVAYLDQTANAFRILNDTQVSTTAGAQAGLLGDQSTATWETGTGTTESLVSPAKVKAAILALAPASTPTTAQVLSATAGATATAVGTYMVAWNNATSPVEDNATTAGSNLGYATSPDLSPFNTTSSTSGTSSLPGTWRAMAAVVAQAGGTRVPTLWLRIS